VSTQRQIVLDELRAAMEQRAARRIAIDGVDGAGKSTLAEELHELTGWPVIHADNYLAPEDVRYRRGRMSAEGYYRDSYDMVELREAVLACQSPTLIEGVFLLRPELRACWDFAAYVLASTPTILSRVRERDAAKFADTDRHYFERFLPGHELYRSETKPTEIADVIVDNDDPALPRLFWRPGTRVDPMY
jgi:uridine kinase